MVPKSAASSCRSAFMVAINTRTHTHTHDPGLSDCIFFICKRQISWDAPLQLIACLCLMHLSVTACDVSLHLLSWDVRRHCRPSSSRPSSAPLPLLPPSALMLRGTHCCSCSRPGSLSVSTALLWLWYLEPHRANSPQWVWEFKMCYISDWPKRFLKPVLLQLSRHQVCFAEMLASRPHHWTGPQHRARVCRV